MNELKPYAGRGQTLQTNSTRASEIVSLTAREMARANGGERVPLDDLAAVKATAEAYLFECAEHGVMPTTRGVAAALGYTRNALYERARNNRGGQFEAWLRDFSEAAGECLAQAALEGTVSAIPAIFVLKSRYGWTDTPEPEIRENGAAEELSPEVIASKYVNLPD